MTDSDDKPRWVITVRLMFSDESEAQNALLAIEQTTGGVLAGDYDIVEV